MDKSFELSLQIPTVVACACNLATLKTKFRNDVRPIPVGGNSPSIGEWNV